MEDNGPHQPAEAIRTEAREGSSTPARGRRSWVPWQLLIILIMVILIGIKVYPLIKIRFKAKPAPESPAPDETAEPAAAKPPVEKKAGEGRPAEGRSKRPAKPAEAEVPGKRPGRAQGEGLKQFMALPVEEQIRKGRPMLAQAPLPEPMKAALLIRIEAAEDEFIAGSPDEKPESRKQRLHGLLADEGYPSEFQAKVKQAIARLKVEPAPAAPPTEIAASRRPAMSDEELLERFVPVAVDREALAHTNVEVPEDEGMARRLNRVCARSRIIGELGFYLGDLDRPEALDHIPVWLRGQTDSSRRQWAQAAAASLRLGIGAFDRMATLLKEEFGEAPLTLEYYQSGNKARTGFTGLENGVLTGGTGNTGQLPLTRLALEEIETRIGETLTSQEMTGLGVYYLLRSDLYSNLQTAMYCFKKAGISEAAEWQAILGKFQDEQVILIIGQLAGESPEDSAGMATVRPPAGPPFRIDRQEVSNRDFKLFLDALPREQALPEGIEISPAVYANVKKYPDHPVTGINWFTARAYADWVGKRLPTAAEWTAAAVDRPYKTFPWGYSWRKDLVVHQGSANGGPRETAGLSRGRTFSGCLHMSGNAAEWLAGRALAGGGFDQPLSDCSLDSIVPMDPWKATPSSGLRCAMDYSPPAETPASPE